MTHWLRNVPEVELDRVVETSSIWSDRDFARELTLLAGLAIPVRGRWQATASGGFSGIRMYRYIAEPCNTPVYIGCWFSDGGKDMSDVIMGIPFEAGIDGPVFGRLGMGVRAFVNLNSGEHYSGFSLEFRLLPASRSTSSK